jgi:hypothetical protein
MLLNPLKIMVIEDEGSYTAWLSSDDSLTPFIFGDSMAEVLGQLREICDDFHGEFDQLIIYDASKYRTPIVLSKKIQRRNGFLRIKKIRGKH